MHFVSFDGKIAPVDTKEIESLRILVNSTIPVLPRAFLHLGDWVVIKKGPLAGAEGVLEKFQKGYRIVVPVSLLQRSVSAEVDIDWVSAVGGGLPRRPASAGETGTPRFS
jgi:transcription antitermination factor NusG